jgi:hypothetical protein
VSETAKSNPSGEQRSRSEIWNRNQVCPAQINRRDAKDIEQRSRNQNKTFNHGLQDKKENEIRAIPESAVKNPRSLRAD